MAVAHASSSTALIEMFRSGAIGGRRMIPAKGNTNGAPVMVGDVDLRSIVADAVHIARFRTLSDADLVTTLPGGGDKLVSFKAKGTFRSSE
jgi:hypothetical protein